MTDDLPRYGRPGKEDRWEQMPDGHWTPWHLAAAEVARLRAVNEAQAKEIKAKDAYIAELVKELNDFRFARAMHEANAAKNRLTADVELLHDLATRCGDMLALIRSKAPL
jgi:arginine/ornithine N-succinyltransferase beta subunit